MTTAITHRCLAARDCRKREKDGKPAYTEQPDTLCPACLTRIESAIRQLPRDFAELREALGERTAMTGQRIRSTPTPAILISTRKEALMAAIADMADRAAAIISDLLHTEQPTGRRKPPAATADGTSLAAGSIAWCAAEAARASTGRALTAAVAIVEPNLDLLAASPAEPALIWAKPERCDIHQKLIDAADAMHAAAVDANKPNIIKQADEHARRAYAAAGLCDDCNGWWKHGQERELTEISGIQIALELIELHNQTRAELGLTRLRHRYPMPCPRCGNRVGRDDGETIITCDDRDSCKASWTEREYQFLAGLITRERLDMEILKYLLAEAYTRLDDVQKRLDMITEDDAAALTLPGAGAIVVEAVRQALGEHQRPEKRAVGTDKEATQERQTNEDGWAWKNESPYRPPKRKPRKATRPVGSPIAASSLTTLVDIDEDAALNGHAACPDCNLYHVGECA